MAQISIEKFDGLGNDFFFVKAKVLDSFASISGLRCFVSQICSRKSDFMGGADGVVFYKDSPDYCLLIVNSDGSFAPTCGNALRAYGYMLFRAGLWGGDKHLSVSRLMCPLLSGALKQKNISDQIEDKNIILKDEDFIFETERPFSRLLSVKSGQIVSIAFAPPKLVKKLKMEMDPAAKLQADKRVIQGNNLSPRGLATGSILQNLNESFVFEPVFVELENQHLIFFSDLFLNFDSQNFNEFGKSAQTHEFNQLLSKLNNVDISVSNINMVFINSSEKKQTFPLTVYERGAGLTQACGSGAVATACALKLHNLIEHLDVPVNLSLPGGTSLVDFSQADIILSGQASFVNSGIYPYDFK